MRYTYIYVTKRQTLYVCLLTISNAGDQKAYAYFKKQFSWTKIFIILKCQKCEMYYIVWTITFSYPCWKYEGRQYKNVFRKPNADTLGGDIYFQKNMA